MKIILLISASILLTFTAKSQNVNIPDVAFKSFLVNDYSINTNKDTEIQKSEAAAFSAYINCSDRNISDLTGIEAFTTLTALNRCK